MTLRDSNIIACEAYTTAAIDDFYQWLFNSNEARQFNTVCIDSVTQQCEIVLREALGKRKDGRQAYGDLEKKMGEHIERLFFMPQMHTYLICKQGVSEENGIKVRVPYFPGQALSVKIPHLYDEILHLDLATIQGVGQNILSFRCQPSFDVRARDRSGRLAEFEQPDLTYIFNKALGG